MPVPCCCLPSKTVPLYICRHITGMCCSSCTSSLPRGSQQHLDNPTCAVLSVIAAFLHSFTLLHRFSPPSTPKAPRGSAPPCKTSLLLPGGIPSSLRLSTHLMAQLPISPCALWVCGCAPHTFTPPHTYLSTPTCEYLLAADLTYLVLFHCAPWSVFMTLEALLSLARLLGLHSLQHGTVLMPSGTL